MAEKNEQKLEQIVFVNWVESEKGFGTRPDGCSLHTNKTQYDTFLEQHWAEMPEGLPDEYSKPDSEPIKAFASSELYERIKDSDNGLRLGDTERTELEKNKDLIFLGKNTEEGENHELDKALSFVRELDLMDYKDAMDLINESQNPLPQGYNFSHYVYRGQAGMNTPEPDKVIAAFEEDMKNTHTLEITAIYKRDPKSNIRGDKEIIKRSVAFLYISQDEKTVFINGKDKQGQFEMNDIIDAVNAYKK